VKTTVEIEDSLFAEAERFAASHGASLDRLIEIAVVDLIREQRSAVRFQFRKHAVLGNGKAEGLDWPAMRDEIYRGRGA
jgi:hypothetical protein